MIAPLTIPVVPAAAAQAAALDAVVPVLRTERTMLRAPRLTDFSVLHSITGSDRNSFEGGPSTPEESWADFCAMTATWLLRGHGMWTLEHDGAAAGFILIGTEPGDREHELGWLMTAEFEGRGLATEGAQAALAHARDVLTLPSLVSYIPQGNTRSERIAARLGAQPDGTLLHGTVTVWRHWGAGA
ncbi:GNAT family N-acetyltransferase [Jannaschia seohaensis]|uniref:Protein N-acetyltransferase, RimJ/RimL family n=1 Tax=Jannaschia seohaensis TaxID=475081 RepID=A0A2Y9B4H5_9RHOB|nr:GNAT family N-acetyltransferase [Jannaschia seohaensis]PWJ16187.1 RimJ/RimL family protein N-acetyltransferase [Jannaschia seohaensis]SSA49199.1 Protein N-acetyltransferase, RimJ/RimL family [Jannaschia seohaensis]